VYRTRAHSFDDGNQTTVTTDTHALSAMGCRSRPIEVSQRI